MRLCGSKRTHEVVHSAASSGDFDIIYVAIAQFVINHVHGYNRFI